MAVLLFLAFVFGALTAVAVEVLVLWILIRRLSQKVEGKGAKGKDTAASTDLPRDLGSSLSEKQGFLWILDSDKVAASIHHDKTQAERKRRKEIFEVTPSRKYARLKDQRLVIREPDGSSVEISLTGCTIVAVSASSMASRKWAKRYPIKVESKDSAVYKGYNCFYVYLETSWEKEAWCKALRLASFDNDKKIIWFSELTRDFQCYLASLSSRHLPYLKPSADSNSESGDKLVKLENTSSKLRLFLKKLAKKARANDYKAGEVLVSGYDGKKTTTKSFSLHHTLLDNDSKKMDAKGKSMNIVSDGTRLAPPNLNELDSKELTSGASSVDPNARSINEEALCLNILVSRLFFDVKNNVQIMTSIQTRIQRTLSSMRVPSYIGEVICTAVNLGTLPPHILAMRAIPSDLSEVWSFEVNFEYLGGLVLDIETRLEIQELEFEGESTHLNTNSGREVTSDLLEGLEQFEKQLNHSEEKIDETEKAEGSYSDAAEISTGDGPAPSHGSRWKSLVHSITKQVSQVPLSMAIRISSLSGTLQLSLKTPPSDQIWYGFTSSPDIEFTVETSVGDRKITSSRVSQFMINRLKTSIRDALVLPNCESLSIPWMLAEKDDWVPRKSAPFAWYRSNQDSSADIQKQELPSFKHGTAAVPSPEANQATTDVKREKGENSSSLLKMATKSMDQLTISSNPVDESALEEGSLQELSTPLLIREKLPERSTRNVASTVDVHVDSTPAAGTQRGLIQQAEDDDSGQRRIGARERMRGLGKKVGEKLEVKRRHIEEKGRSFVEKMRGQ